MTNPTQFRFTEEERLDIQAYLTGFCGKLFPDTGIARIESFINEREASDGWISVDSVKELHKLHWCEIQNEVPNENTSTTFLGYKSTYGGEWMIYWLDGMSGINPARPIVRVLPLPQQPFMHNFSNPPK